MGLFGKKQEDDALKKYNTVYLGGYPENTKKTYNIDFAVKQEGFSVKSHYNDKKFKDFEIEYAKVRNFEIVQRQVSTVEGLLGGLDSRQLNQANNINITYLGDNDLELTVRLEMITGVTVMGQAAKCAELMDFLKANGITGKFSSNNGSDDKPEKSDPLILIQQLADLVKQGILTNEEFEAKKAELLKKI